MKSVFKGGSFLTLLTGSLASPHNNPPHVVPERSGGLGGFAESWRLGSRGRMRAQKVENLSLLGFSAGMERSGMRPSPQKERDQIRQLGRSSVRPRPYIKGCATREIATSPLEVFDFHLFQSCLELSREGGCGWTR